MTNVMSDLERRCVDAAMTAPPDEWHKYGPLAIVRAVLAEAHKSDAVLSVTPTDEMRAIAWSMTE